MLDSAGYGTVIIKQAVSIVAPDGIEGGITTASFVDAITINAGGNDVVNLRGLTLVGGGVGANGITFNSGKALNVQNCVVRGFTRSGLNLQPVASSSFTVSDTIAANNSTIGVLVSPTGSNATNTAFFERVQAMGNNFGFSMEGGSATGGTLQATAADSAAANNNTGFDAFSVSGGVTTTFTIASSKATGNGTGVSAEGFTNVTAVLAQTTISGNAHGFTIADEGTIDTFKNNNIVDGGNTGTLTAILQQ